MLPATPGHRRARSSSARDTHALSEPAFRTALEVLAANGVDVMVDRDEGYTPTPAVSHAILTYNRGRTAGLADGIVITPSHNPPEDGGFKYNPPHGGPADTDVTREIQDERQSPAVRESARRRSRDVEEARAPTDDASARLCRVVRRRPRFGRATWRSSGARVSASASIRWAARASATGSRSPIVTGSTWTW